MKKNILYIILGLNVCFFSANADQVVLGISPLIMHFNLSASSERQKVYTIKNLSSKAFEVELSELSYPIGEGEGPFAKDHRIYVSASDFDLKPYMNVSPKTLVFKPYGENEANVQVKLPDHLQAGTYYAAVFFTINSASVKNSESTLSKKVEPLSINKTNDVLSFNYTVLVNSASMVYVNVGKPDYSKVTVSCLNKAPGDVVIHVHNASPFVFSPKYSIYEQASDKSVVSSYLTSVLGYSEANRDFSFDSKDKSAHYQISWVADNGVKSQGMIVCQ